MLGLTRRMSVVLAVVVLHPLIAEADSSGMFAPERVGHWYLGGGLGGFKEESNSQLQNQDGQSGGFFSGGYRLAPNIAVEIDGLFFNQRLDTPPTVSTSNTRSRLNSGGAGGVVKFILPLDRVELYAGGGLGIYTTSLRVKDSSFHSERDDTDFGYQGLIGADIFLSRRFSIGVEYRKIKLDADLEPTIPGKIDVGGDLLFLTVRGHF
jgi:opacity protein-like surface antigen